MLLCFISKVCERLYQLAGALAALCLVAMALCVVTSIVSRLVEWYVPGLTEIAGYLMGAANCLALAYTFRNKAHIQVTLFVEKLSQKYQAVLALFALAVTGFVCCYLAYYMCRLTYFSWDFEEVSDGSVAFPLWVPQSVVAFGTIVLAISVMHSFLEFSYRVIRGDLPESDESLGGVK
ncbi:TRAP transporter small permease [Marinomonas sp. THO17]|uniref:TRAP transporter small permease n=1 Tax=Marinomonas sp. THO17 TaxID=3149048 RepID=UPI00336BEAF5